MKSLDLLLSVAMGHHKSFTSQALLANHFKTLMNDEILFQAYSSIDRAAFVDTKQDYYGPGALKLNDCDNMTTPIMHVIPATIITQHLRDGQSFLDVGTGHGYLPMLIQKYSELKGQNIETFGIDTTPDCILNAKKIATKLNNKAQFKLENFLSSWTLHHDVINVGFGLQRRIIDRFANNPKNVTMLCPLILESGQQWLTLFQIQNGQIQEERLMECLFQGVKDLDDAPEVDQLKEAQEELQQVENYIKSWAQKNKVGLAAVLKDETMVKSLERVRQLKRIIKSLSKK